MSVSVPCLCGCEFADRDDSGLWIVFPVYLGYVFGVEIVEGLGVAAEGGKKNR